MSNPGNTLDILWKAVGDMKALYLRSPDSAKAGGHEDVPSRERILADIRIE